MLLFFLDQRYYGLWFRHTGERDPGDDWADNQTQHLTGREIKEILQGQYTITHMIIYHSDLSDDVLEMATGLTELTHLKIIYHKRQMPQRQTIR